MSEVLKMDIFFVIASIATVFFSILLCVALYQVIKILKIIRRVLERVEAGSEVIAEDVATIRSYVVNGGVLSRIMSFVIGLATTQPTRRRRRGRPRGTDEDGE